MRAMLSQKLGFIDLTEAKPEVALSQESQWDSTRTGVGSYMPSKEVVGSLATDTRALVGERRNASLYRLQNLIASVDPEERGVWATQEVTVESCTHALRRKSINDFPPERLEDIVRKLGVHVGRGVPSTTAPKMIHLLHLTSLDQLEEVFGPELVESVMQLQSAVAADLTNQLVNVCQGVEAEVEPTFCNAVAAARSRKGSVLIKIIRHQSWLGVIEGLGSALVILNTIMLGVSLDFSPGWQGWDILSAVFGLIFLLELIWRLVLAGGPRAFFLGKNGKWHLVDALIVSLALLDIVSLVATHVQHLKARALMLMRMARLLRLTRITRLGRTGIFHELIYMLKGIEAGTSTLLWALVLLLLVCYTGAVVLTQTVGHDTDEFIEPYVKRHFSSVLMSMFTLFRCFTGDCVGYDGTPLSYVVVAQYGNVAILVYWCSIMVVSFGFFNIMTANFLQNARRASRFSDSERRRMLRKEREEVNMKTAALLKRIGELYSDGRKSTGGDLADIRLSREMFFEMLRDQKITEWLDDMGCDDGLRQRLFDKIDADGNGVLETAELVTGIVELLRGKFDNTEALTMQIRSINARLLRVQALLFQHQAGSGETADRSYLSL